MNIKNTLLFVVTQLLFFVGLCQNQEIKTIKVLNNQNYYLTSVGLLLTDSDVSLGQTYGNDENYKVTLYNTNCLSPNKLNLIIEEFDIEQGDTLYIYDGSNENSPLLYKGNNSNSCLYNSFFASNGVVTIIFKSDNKYVGSGFTINIVCNQPCQDIIIQWDSVFYRIKNNEFIPKLVKQNPEDTEQWYAFDICNGDDIAIPLHINFPENYTYYEQNLHTTTLSWDFGDGVHNLLSGDTIPTHHYIKTQGYNVTVLATDINGCHNKHILQGRVRISDNPINTIFQLPPICEYSSIDIFVGEGDSVHIKTQTMEDNIEINKSRSFQMFIPDGPKCDKQCFNSPIIFTEFPVNKKIINSDDICSICVNLEHEYMGDLEISIICPEGNKTILKYKPEENIYNPEGIIEYPGGGGGNFYFGIPYGGNIHLHYNGQTDTTYCDTLFNLPGIGWNYCWSNNKEYGYWDINHNYNANYENAIYITKPQNQIPITYNFGDSIPNGYINNNPPPYIQTFHTTDSSHKFVHRGFYKPSTDFNSLIGCSLNGEWNIEICDTWTRDNGWLFGWSMEICNSYETDWTYNVGIDTVLWNNNPNFNIISYNKTYTNIMPHDTLGEVNINFSIIDSLHCQWDSSISITVINVPQPNLGNDTIICDYMSITLDAQDGSDNNQYKYLWYPTLDTTPIIHTLPSQSDISYKVEVTNTSFGLNCQNSDEIKIHIAPNPVISLSIDKLSFIEGCEPLEINIENYTSNVIKHYWDFGDGDNSKSKNVKHTYYAGVYDLSYTTTDKIGCTSTIFLPNFINVYPQPKAKFQWTPEILTMLEPTVQFHNLTMPHNDDNIYYWNIQYDKNNQHSFTTIQEYEPQYTFQQFNNISLTGEYIVQLIALTQNLTPSGNWLICSDTTQAKILIINDFLQFPNVVTPNGDGINDRFQIVNLIEHIGFPNNELTILNRWGNVIFYQQNIDINSEFWDPNLTNSPTGTYFYRFTAKGYNGNIQRNGVIEVLR